MSTLQFTIFSKLFRKAFWKVSVLAIFLTFRQKMYTTITDIVEEKRIDLAYLIWNLDLIKEVTVISMFSDNIQYQIREPLKVLLIANKERQLLEGVFTDRELNTSIGRKLISTPLDANDNVVKTEVGMCNGDGS